MRRHLFATYTFLYCLSSYAQTDWTVKDTFFGPVKTVKYTHFKPRWYEMSYKDSVATFDHRQSQRITFDSFQKPLKHEMMWNDTLDKYNVWAYGDNGKCISETAFYLKSKGQFTKRYFYKNEQLIMESYFEKHKKPYYSILFTYDSISKTNRAFELFNNDTFLHWIQKHSMNPKRIDYYGFSEGADTTYFSNKQYFDNDLIERKKEKNSTIFLRDEVTFWNDNGTVKQIMHFNQDGKFIKSTNFDYDAFGNILKETSYGCSHFVDITYHKYIYDTHNNWIERRIFTDYSYGKKEVGKVYREIEYY